jgi:hypothetical protein
MRLLIARLLVATIGLTIAFGPRTHGQQPATPRSFTLHFPAGIDMSTVQISNAMSGPFGGAGVKARPGPNPQEYSLATSYEGVEARTMKVIVFVPNYQFVTLDVDLTKEARDATIALTPLALVRVRGHVVPSGSFDLNGARIKCTMLAGWGMDFFGDIDGMPATFGLGSQPLTTADHYAFTIDLPDAARDPLAMNDTEFMFVAYRPTSEFVVLRHLSNDPLGLIRAMRFYPPDLLLTVDDR